jgi:transcriptional regulator with XRE-family HTH domain
MSVSFGDSIRRGREIAGLSQAKVAELIGKSPSTIRSWELGRTSPAEAAAVSALAAVLGINESTLLRRAGFDEPAPVPRLSLEQELAALRSADPTPIPPPDPLATTTTPKEKAKKPLGKPAFAGLRQGPPRHLIPKGIGLQPVPPLLAAATAPPEKAEPGPISITVVPAPEPAPTARERKVTMLPRLGTRTARSYVEDSDQRYFYRWRGAVTAIALVAMFVTFWWALRNLGGAISDFVGGFIDQLNF